MRIRSELLLFCVVLYCQYSTAYGFALELNKRELATEEVSNSHRGAVLILGRLQTSCEVALLDSQNGIVAASCFIYLSDGNVDNNQDYKIGIHDPVSSTNYIYTLDRIDTHPGYDKTNFANNIAVIGFNVDEQQSWNSSAAGHRSEWSSVYYTSRSMDSVSKNIWGVSEVAELATDRECGSASNLYGSNADWMLCVSQARVSSENGNCEIPYGTSWAIYQPDNMAVAAVYSHSAITSDSLCQATNKQYHYYTMLEPYMPWIRDISGTSLSTFWLDSSYSYSGTSGFSMISSAGTNSTDYKTIAGNFYPMQREYALVTKSNLDTSSANQFNTEPSTETTDNNKNKINTDDSNVSSVTEDNLSSDDIIAVAIVVPIVTIAITVGLYFLYKWWRRHQNSVRWDPKGERENFYRMRFVDDISINDTRECNTPIEYNLIQCPPVSAHVGFLRPPLSSTLSPGNTSWSVTTTHTYWETNRATRLPAYSPSENADVYLSPEKATFH